MTRGNAQVLNAARRLRVAAKVFGLPLACGSRQRNFLRRRTGCTRGKLSFELPRVFDARQRKCCRCRAKNTRGMCKVLMPRAQRTGQRKCADLPRVTSARGRGSCLCRARGPRGTRTYKRPSAPGNRRDLPPTFLPICGSSRSLRLIHLVFMMSLYNLPLSAV